MSREQSHQRHAAVYIDRKGTKAIVVARHYNGAGGMLVEDEEPTVVEDLADTEKLTSVVVQALASSSVRDEVNLRERVAKDWPAFTASGAKSKRAFEAEFIVLSIHGANDANVTYKALRLRAEAAGWYADAWPRPDRMILSVVVNDPETDQPSKTLRIDFDGENIAVGYDATHQLVDEWELPGPDGDAEQRSFSELASDAADWFEQQLALHHSEPDGHVHELARTPTRRKPTSELP